MISEEVCDWDDDDGRSEVSGSKTDSLNLSSLDFWDYSVEFECLNGPEDLRLAAELGKTLLERNKELETNLKDYQRVVDDQAKDIEHLTKQVAALRKANDSRIRIYETLEVSIQELERANQKLAYENAADKKQIKSLYAYRDTLESRCEELQKALNDSITQQQIQKEQIRKLSTKNDTDSTDSQKKASAISQTSIEVTSAEEELINQLTKQNQELKSQTSKDQRKIADLEEEISRTMQDMALLSQELQEREMQVNSLRSKMSVLEEEDVSSANFCGRCCRELDFNRNQQLDDDQKSSGVHLDSREDYSCSSFVDMYNSKTNSRLSSSKNSPINGFSLIDEFQSTLFDDEESLNKEKRLKIGNIVKGKVLAATGTDEEETSSGFSDETCNKSTQTERNFIPGSFLCSIADGDDCKFSIYDDACPVESRFRKTPEYRTLFREIFAVLKRAAEAKENGEQLPLLNDLTPVTEAPKVPPVTPATEEPPIDFEDVQSLSESIAASEIASEVSSVVNEKVEDNLKDLEQPSTAGTAARDKGRTNDILEYVSISLDVKKKQKRKSINSPSRKVGESLDSSPNSPRKSGRRRKEWRNYDSPQSDSRTQSPAFQPRSLTSLHGRESLISQPFVSNAAMQFAKLKKLEKSYAEVLMQPRTYARSRPVRLK